MEHRGTCLTISPLTWEQAPKRPPPHTSGTPHIPPLLPPTHLGAGAHEAVYERKDAVVGELGHGAQRAPCDARLKREGRGGEGRGMEQRGSSLGGAQPAMPACDAIGGGMGRE